MTMSSDARGRLQDCELWSLTSCPRKLRHVELAFDLLCHTAPFLLWTWEWQQSESIVREHFSPFVPSSATFLLCRGPAFTFLYNNLLQGLCTTPPRFMWNFKLQPEAELCVSWDCVLTTCRIVGLQPMMKGKLRKPLMRWAIRTGNSLCRYLALLWRLHTR